MAAGASSSAQSRSRRKVEAVQSYTESMANSSSARSPIQLPPLRNFDPRRIEQNGFVECCSLLPDNLCDEIAQLPMAISKQISNASELDLGAASANLARRIKSELGSNSTLCQTVESLFGTRDFIVPTLKVLEASSDADPQIPHADDFWNRELFGVVHVRAGQQPTQAVVYDASAAYPTGLWCECAHCGSYISIPDHVARRRGHLNRPFLCSTVGSTCEHTRSLSTAPAQADEARERAVAEGMRDAFSQLLFRAVETVSCMRPIGCPQPQIGDAVVGLPTLIHRGPGGRQGAVDAPLRRVLFFTLRPRFTDARATAEGTAYDADKQIHAAWLLWFCNDVLDDVARSGVKAAYKKLGHNLADFESA